MKTKVWSIVAAALIWAGPVLAHHSFAMFDYNKEVTVIGEVKVLRWTNPHMHLLIDAPDGNGGMAEFDFEGGTPNNLKRAGWTKDTLKPGEKVTVVMHPLKNGMNGGMFVRATRADGTPVGTPPAAGQ